MTEVKLMQLIGIAEEHFRDQGYWIDDVRWGVASFAFEIYDQDAGMFDAAEGTFHFVYDPEDVFERIAERQLEDKLSEWEGF